MKRLCGIVALMVAITLLAEPALARIKLTALPARERVEIQLDNGRYTLVEEERIIPLLQSTVKTGLNQIDFSWSNTKIDKNSVRFRPLGILENGKTRPIRAVDGGLEVAVVSVAYPPAENALVWQVYAARGCAVKVRVSYLIHNLTRTFHYQAVANRAETELELRSYIQLSNYSGEGFGREGVWMGYGDRLLDPRSVGQQEDIKMLLYRFRRVPLEKTFTYDWYRFGPLDRDRPNASRVLMHYRLVNDSAHGLGRVPLEPGKVRLYIRDSRGGRAFLGEDWGEATPVGSTMRIFVGDARDLMVKRMVEFKETRPVRGNLFDLEVRIRYEIENFKDTPVRLDLVEQLNRVADEFAPGTRHDDVHWTLGAATSRELAITRDYGGASPVLHVDLPARPADNAAVDNAAVKKTVVVFHLTLKNLWK